MLKTKGVEAIQIRVHVRNEIITVDVCSHKQEMCLCTMTNQTPGKLQLQPNKQKNDLNKQQTQAIKLQQQ